MKLEDAIHKTLKEYPALFKDVNLQRSRIKILDHLFLVIGNGYEWTEDGYLTEPVYKKRGAGTLKTPKYGKQKFEWRADSTWFETPIYREELEEFRKVLVDKPEYKDFFEQKSVYVPTPYPVCEYSKICTVPENVKPDWLAGAIEAAEWAKSFYEGPPAQVMQSNFIKTVDIKERAVSIHVKEQHRLTCKALLNLRRLEKNLTKT